MTKLSAASLSFTGLAALLLFSGAACDRSSRARVPPYSVLAFIAQIASNGVDAPPSEYTVFMRSGQVLRFDTSTSELREARLSTTDLATLRNELQKSHLASFPSVYLIPPDAAHTLIGLPSGTGLQHYAYTGDKRVLETNLSPDTARFLKAWMKARSAIGDAMPKSWNVEQDASQDLDDLWDLIAER
jgi:hypothetical protein